MVFLVYRTDEKTGKKFGPYAVRSVRISGCDTPRQEYLGRAVVKADETVVLMRTGEILGRVAGHNEDVVKVEIVKIIED